MFSVAPCHNPSTCFEPYSSTPSAVISVCPANSMLSISKATNCKSPSRRSHSSRNWLAVARTK
jgi:hypothetical protein